MARHEIRSNPEFEWSEQPGSDRTLQYAGMCVGGPMTGEGAMSRYPKGFLLVDRPAGMVWVYDYISAKAQFLVREPEGRPIDDEKRLKAGLGQDWDVRAQ